LSDRKPERQEAIQAALSAIAIYEDLLRQQPEDATALGDLATTLASLGRQYAQQRGGSAEAVRQMQRARDIMQRLIGQQPESLRLRLKLAELHHDMYGNLVGDRRRQDEALQSSQDALNVYNELLERAPQSPRFKSQLGIIRDDRAVLYLREKRMADAIREAREARRILAEVVRANPDNERYQGYLGKACMRLGNALATTACYEEALDPLRESCDAFEHLLESRPGVMGFQSEYILALSTLGRVMGRLGRNDESVSVLKRASQSVTDLCRRDPTNVFLRGNLMDCKFNLAFSLTRSDRRDLEAVAAYEESLSIAKEVFGEGDWSHGDSNAAVGHISMAYSLREIGRDKEAEQALAKGRESLGNDGPSFYELARYDARSAQRLEGTGRNVHAIDALKERALVTLQRAVTLGLSDRLCVRKFGEMFQVLDRPEFQLILLDLAFPADPFK
jgi:eukaryotic-like serine/threonine-protein kinase